MAASTSDNRPCARSEHDVYIIEVGYTGVLQHADKLTQNTIQHARLKEELTRADWTVNYMEAQIVTPGSTGTLMNTLNLQPTHDRGRRP